MKYMYTTMGVGVAYFIELFLSRVIEAYVYMCTSTAGIRDNTALRILSRVIEAYV